MNYEDLIPEPSSEMDTFEREERCRKTIKSILKACIMRIAVAVLLVLAFLRADVEPWIWGLLILVLLLTLSGLLPLAAELKKRRQEMKEILAEEE